MPYQAPTSVMTLISWNCRGIGQTPTINEMWALARKWRPDIIFLSETKANNSFVSTIMHGINFNFVCIIPPKGLAGVLSMAWRFGLDLEIVVEERGCIGAIIQSGSRGSYFLLLLTIFPNTEVTNLPAESSDHGLIVINIDGGSRSGSRPFRFIAAWMKDESSKQVVSKAWELRVLVLVAFSFVRRLEGRKRR